MRIKYDVEVTYYDELLLRYGSEIIEQCNCARNGEQRIEFIYYYYDTGQLLRHGYLKNEKDDGEHIIYNKDGSIYKHVFYENGKKINKGGIT